MVWQKTRRRLRYKTVNEKAIFKADQLHNTNEKIEYLLKIKWIYSYLLLQKVFKIWGRIFNFLFYIK